ncbi:MAG: NUDIX hydrolase [Candidatus Nanoarchaeia archaeon]
MVEQIEVYDLAGNLIGVQDRKKFYEESKKEFEQKGSISHQTKTIRLLLLNSKGRIYLQKRSRLKEDNGGLYDKTVGGHVVAGDSFNITVVRECAEELGFPAAVLSEEEFNKAIRVTDLTVIGVFRQVEVLSNYASTRTSKEGQFVQPHFTAIYIGYFDGAIRFIDGECSGIDSFSLEELEQEIKDNPEKFTADVLFIIERYRQHLKARPVEDSS